MLTLVTGGCRSGEAAGPRAFLATAQPLDEEMEARILKHKRRRGAGWRLIEEPVRVPEAIEEGFKTCRTVILDCVTLWISNLLCAEHIRSEEEAFVKAEALLAAARKAPGDIIVITNEVGSGIVPANRLSRLFRDCAGRVNQTLARAADAVWLLVSGIPVPLRAPGPGLKRAPGPVRAIETPQPASAPPEENSFDA
jgi:adenosylcobinamide kinase/adenosylcobinamide-phosphate guanylyltransferase